MIYMSAFSSNLRRNLVMLRSEDYIPERYAEILFLFLGRRFF